MYHVWTIANWKYHLPSIWRLDALKEFFKTLQEDRLKEQIAQLKEVEKTADLNFATKWGARTKTHLFLKGWKKALQLSGMTWLVDSLSNHDWRIYDHKCILEELRRLPRPFRMAWNH